MDFPSQSIIELLTYLLPGFIVAEILYNLAPGAPRRTPFDRIVQALIFTVIVQVCVFLIRLGLINCARRGLVLGVWSEEVRFVWSVVAALSLGLFFAWMANYDVLHKHLRRFGVTQQTSYSSEWFGAFSEHTGHVVLHLVGERRVFGWAVEWPNRPDAGHFVLSQVLWLDDNKARPAEGVRRALIKATDVEMVEFMYRDQSQMKEDRYGRPEGLKPTTNETSPTRQRETRRDSDVPSTTNT